MFLEKIVWLNYILHYLYQSQTSNVFIFIKFLANLEANLQMWKNIMLQMLFLQTIIKMCLWTDRSQCDTKWCSMFESMETFLHTLPNWKSVMAIVTSCLTTSMLCIGMNTKLSFPLNILIRTLGDCTLKEENWPQEMLKTVSRNPNKQSEFYC